MRRSLIVLALALLVAPAAAQPMNFTEAHQVRVAFGDIPSTHNVTESTGQWNVHETLSTGTRAPVTWHLPTGYRLGDIACECEYAVDASNAPTYNITFLGDTATQEAEVDLVFTYDAPGDMSRFGSTLMLRDDAMVVIYTADGLEVTAASTSQRLPAIDAAGLFFDYFAAPDEGAFWFTVAPAATAVDPTVPEPTKAPFLTAGGLLIGAAVGMVVWALLVKQGLVQKRVRKQVAATAAHVEVAKAESAETLEARKRVLMAGLKELEKAKMTKEMETEVYDTLKAELKKETVTVMRALEAAK